MKSFPLRFGIALLVLFCVVCSSSCASGNGPQRPPDVAVAQVGTDVLKAATLLQNEVNRLTAARTMPVALGQTITDANKKVSDKAPQLSSALKAYHAATSLADRSSKAAEVQKLITELSGPLSEMLGVKLPDGAAASVSGLIGGVMSAVGAIQAEIAKGLTSAVYPALMPGLMRSPLFAVA